MRARLPSRKKTGWMEAEEPSSAPGSPCEGAGASSIPGDDAPQHLPLPPSRDSIKRSALHFLSPSSTSGLPATPRGRQGAQPCRNILLFQQLPKKKKENYSREPLSSGSSSQTRRLCAPRSLTNSRRLSFGLQGVAGETCPYSTSIILQSPGSWES